jgi:hypothetical protein
MCFGECAATDSCVLNKDFKEDSFKRRVLIVFSFAVLITDQLLLRSDNRVFCFNSCRSRGPDFLHFPRFIIAFKLYWLLFHWFKIIFDTVYPSILQPTNFLFLPCMLHVFYLLGVDFVLPEASAKFRNVCSMLLPSVWAPGCQYSFLFVTSDHVMLWWQVTGDRWHLQLYKCGQGEQAYRLFRCVPLKIWRHLLCTAPSILRRRRGIPPPILKLGIW